jgi:MFS transporter, SET family, sugar efflux transporter
VASLVLPAYADRTGGYLRVMLACGVLTVALAAVLAVVTSLPAAVLGLVVLGAPAGVGSSLLFAHLKDSGASSSEVVNTRAIVSFAWVAGPPLATVIMSTFGNRAILLAIAMVAGVNIATTGAMLVERTAAGAGATQRGRASTDGPGLSRGTVAVILGVFVVLQATNSATVSIMTLFVAQTLGLDVKWAGLALGVAAALEVPALVLIGRLNHRFSSLALIAAGCLAGIAFYAGMAVVSGPLPLLALQLLNAAFFAVVAGVGLPLFQEIIPRPGLASGLYTNTRRLGAIVSGPIIALGSLAIGYRAVFAACGVLTALALLVVALLGRMIRRPGAEHEHVSSERPDPSLGREG